MFAEMDNQARRLGVTSFRLSLNEVTPSRLFSFVGRVYTVNF